MRIKDINVDLCNEEHELGAASALSEGSSVKHLRLEQQRQKIH